MTIAPPRAIVTDIEGTTTSLRFVHDVLFPYSRERLPAFVRVHRDDPEIAQALAEVDADQERAISTLLDWIAEDRKAAPLKLIQGRIWAGGYADGTLKGHVYDDVPYALRAWHERGIALYVYSSGSVAAQKLIFGHSTAGDLTPLFRGYFDTAIGAKIDPASYVDIAEAIGVAPRDVLFLSDNPRELEAAREAGMQGVAVQRDAPIAGTEPFPVIASFADVTF